MSQDDIYRRLGALDGAVAEVRTQVVLAAEAARARHEFLRDYLVAGQTNFAERLVSIESRLVAIEAAIVKIIASAMWQAKGQGDESKG